MSLFHHLEAKHFNRLTNDAVFKQAAQDKPYAYDWFIHVLRSDVGIEEVILSCGYALQWQLFNGESLSEAAKPYSLSDSLKSQLDSQLSVSSERFPEVDPEALRLLATDVWTIINATPDTKSYDDVANTAQSRLPDFLFSNAIKQVAPNLKDVTLFGDQGAESRDTSIRNNSQFPVPVPNRSLELAILERITANVVGAPMVNAEPPVILRYLPGQYYHWHYDHIYPHTEEIAAQIKSFGQRVKTGIFNLNEAFEGGETEFKMANLSLKAKTGQIISFANTDENNERRPESIHRGKEVTQGEKWIMTLWFRDKPYWVRRGLIS